jgi:hypothetical protein
MVTGIDTTIRPANNGQLGEAKVQTPQDSNRMVRRTKLIPNIDIPKSRAHHCDHSPSQSSPPSLQ